MKNKRKKRAVTLIEIMIVILLIGMIGGALAFNMRGSMDKGRVFKSEQNATRVYDALMMEYAQGELFLPEVIENRVSILNKSPFLKDGAKLLIDGWGQPLQIEIQEDDLIVYSSKAKSWENAHKTTKKPQ